MSEIERDRQVFVAFQALEDLRRRIDKAMLELGVLLRHKREFEEIIREAQVARDDKT